MSCFKVDCGLPNPTWLGVSPIPIVFFLNKLCIYATHLFISSQSLPHRKGKSCGFCKVQVAEQAGKMLPPPAERCVYPNLKKKPWRQHPPTVLAVLTVKPKAVGAFPLFLSLWPWPSTAIRLLGGLQCAKAFNGFMSSCDLGPDPWGWKCRYHVSDMPPR